MEFTEKILLLGKTGGPGVIKVKTGFGFVLLGKNSFAGHAFVFFRGTQFLADWLTNLYMLLSRSGTVSGWVIALIRKIAEFLGYRGTQSIDKWAATKIRELLMKLSTKVNEMAKSALSHVLADGKAV